MSAPLALKNLAKIAGDAVGTIEHKYAYKLMRTSACLEIA